MTLKESAIAEVQEMILLVGVTCPCEVNLRDQTIVVAGDYADYLLVKKAVLHFEFSVTQK
jgi:hypothetical protein